jgi:hypothetical protein
MGNYTAIEPVVISTPPSGFASNVGFAAFRRACGPLTLADQHYCVVKLPVWGHRREVVVCMTTYPIPLFLAQCIEVAEFGEFRPALYGAMLVLFYTTTHPQ